MFEAVDLARLQFALTSIYHWLFVPFTLGMTVTVAALEWTYVSTGKEVYNVRTRCEKTTLLDRLVLETEL